LTIAENTELIKSLATGERDFQRAAALLDYYHSTRKEEIAYILDAKGNVLTSSNRRSHNSIVGQDFSHHDYVKQSLRGVTGNYPAFGLATEKRGFTASYPIYHERKIVGIAAIKVSMDSLAMDFERLPGFAFLVSPEGIIFLASNSELTVTSLWPLNNEVIEKLATSRQFGAGPFNVLLPNKPLNGQDIQFEGERYIFTRNIISDLELRGWSIALFSPADQIIIYRLLGIIVTLSLCVLIVSFFMGMEKSLESTADFAVSESRFRTVFESAPGAIFIVDKDNRRIVSVNPFMIDWLGYTEKKLLSMTLDEIRVEGGDSDGECRYRKGDGAVTHVEEVCKPIFFHRNEAILTIARDISDRKKTEELLVSLSLSDGLTGIANRRHFDEFLEQEWRRAIREGTPLSLIMSDIDFFKAYNDTYGHLAGDDCLRQVAGVMRETLRRPGDMAARYGGEEFAMVMARTDLEGAVLLAESLRSLVEALGIPHAGSPSAVRLVTLSLGVATLVPSRDRSSSELVAAADQALYQAKSEGRNCVRAQRISS
jgi:diguanylate cyclase (GGDEF)-like protein